MRKTQKCKDFVKRRLQASTLLVKPACPVPVCSLSGKCQRQLKCRANLSGGRLVHFYMGASYMGTKNAFLAILNNFRDRNCFLTNTESNT